MQKGKIDFLLKLKRKKYRDLHQKFIIENPKVIFEQAQNKDLDSVYVTDTFFSEHRDELIFPNLFRLSDKDFKQVSDLVTPPGILAVFNMATDKKFNFLAASILLLDTIQDPGNLGTILRSADWFGFKDIFLGANCVELYNPKVLSGSMGSIFHLNIHTDINLAEFSQELKNKKYCVAVSDLAGKKTNISSKAKIALVIGNESKGVSQDLKNLADEKIKIFKVGQAESLNAAVAAGILMYELKR
jgi:TrmH family RNA methyltransferase